MKASYLKNMLEDENSKEMMQKREMVRKRRLLRNLTQAWKRKEVMREERGTSQLDDPKAAEELRREWMLSLKKEKFTTKRSVDQSSEGSFLRKAKQQNINYSDRLIPPTPDEIAEEADEYSIDFSQNQKRQDSSSTTKENQTKDSIYTNLAKFIYQKPVQNNVPESEIGELSRFVATDDPQHFFEDDSTTASDNISVRSRLSVKSTLSVKNRLRRTQGKKLCVKFADECGRELELIHWTLTLYSEEENDWLRAIILLLSPRKKMFEFLHVSYNICDKTSISDILKQLGGIATDKALKEQSYVGLLRNEGGRELINSVSIQSYYLSKDEMLIAVVEGYHGSSMMRMAKPIMENKRIMKAVKRAKNKKVTVKRLTSLPKKSSKRKSSSKKKSSNKDTKEVKIFQMPPLPEKQSSSEDQPPYRMERSDSFSDGSSCGSVPEMDLELDLGIIDATAANAYMEDEKNKDKIAITRILNASILNAVVSGVSKKIHRKR